MVLLMRIEKRLYESFIEIVVIPHEIGSAFKHG